jgi:hypothetical protein
MRGVKQVEIMHVTPQEATDIIDTKQPIGLFLSTGVLLAEVPLHRHTHILDLNLEIDMQKQKEKAISDGIYIAIDNSDGNARVKQFISRGDCMQWLKCIQNSLKKHSE